MGDGVVDSLAAGHEGGLLSLEVANGGKAVLGVPDLEDEAWKTSIL